MADAQWSLVAFTVLAQAAVGMTLAVAASVAFGVPISRGLRRVLAVAAVVMAGALAFSVLHLGDPARAAYAVANWGGSWLSREILAAVAFLALLCATLAVGSRGRADGTGPRRLLAASALIGVALVTAMARVYMVATVPPWRGATTPIAFAVTVVLLGAAATLVIVSAEPDDDRPRRLEGWLIGAIVVALLAKLGAAVLLGPPIAADHAAFPAAAPGGVWPAAVWTAVALGVAALAAWVVAWRGGRTSRGFALFALVAFLAAEIASRVIFYASYFRLGV